MSPLQTGRFVDSLGPKRLRRLYKPYDDDENELEIGQVGFSGRRHKARVARAMHGGRRGGSISAQPSSRA